MSINDLVAAFIARHIIADDPQPLPTRLDQQEGDRA